MLHNYKQPKNNYLDKNGFQHETKHFCSIITGHLQDEFIKQLKRGCIEILQNPLITDSAREVFWIFVGFEGSFCNLIS